jgi:hemerythrin superfamily protein
MEGLVATMRDSNDPGVRKEAVQRFGLWLQDHIRWEEEMLFGRTQELLSEQELESLRKDLDDQLPEFSPYPWGPTSRRE